MDAMNPYKQFLSDLYAIEYKGFLCRSGFPHAQHAAHWHSEIEMNFIDKGSVSYLWQGSIISLESRSLSVFWGGLPHQVVDASEDAECYWVYIPLPWVVQWQLPGDLTTALLNGKFFSLPHEDAADAGLGSIKEWMRNLQNTEQTQEIRTIVLLELEAHMRRLALAKLSEPVKNAAKDQKKLSASLSRLEEMVQMIAREYKNQVSLDGIAESAGLHPNYACRLFSQACGISPHTYLNRLRITHAQRLLATTDMKIVDIAMDAGFASLSRFYAIFMDECQCTPSAYRKRFIPPKN